MCQTCGPQSRWDDGGQGARSRTETDRVRRRSSSDELSAEPPEGGRRRGQALCSHEPPRGSVRFLKVLPHAHLPEGVQRTTKTLGVQHRSSRFDRMRGRRKRVYRQNGRQRAQNSSHLTASSEWVGRARLGWRMQYSRCGSPDVEDPGSAARHRGAGADAWEDQRLTTEESDRCNRHTVNPVCTRSCVPTCLGGALDRDSSHPRPDG